jgi:alpha-tubulin suppressor-like RCC1 family protein
MQGRRLPGMVFVCVLAPVALAALALTACVGDEPTVTPPTVGSDAGDVDSAVVLQDASPPIDAPADTTAPALATVTEVAAGGQFGCAVLSDGTVMCWGQSDLGQTGQPLAGNATCNGTPCRLPARVAGLTNAKHVAAGATTACASTTTGDVYCWGDNAHGQLGHPAGTMSDEDCLAAGIGNVKCSRVPRQVTGVTNITEMAVSGLSACALDTAGAISCWGSNGLGELGRGTVGTDNEAPKAIATFGGVVAKHIAADDTLTSHFCASLVNGSVWCWGRNVEGEVGIPAASSPVCMPSTPCTSTPTNVKQTTSTSFTAVEGLAAGAGVTCVTLTTPKETWCWGYRGYAVTDPAGSQADRSPAKVNMAFSGVSGSNSHMCALAVNGVVKCWGANDDGELGVLNSTTPETCTGGTTYCSFTPQTVPVIHAAKLAVSRRLSLAVSPEGKLYGWGRNEFASLGHIPTPAESNLGCFEPCSPTPVEIPVP